MYIHFYGDYTYETETELSNFLSTVLRGQNFQREFPYGRWNNRQQTFKIISTISVCGNNIKKSGNIYRNTGKNKCHRENCMLTYQKIDIIFIDKLFINQLYPNLLNTNIHYHHLGYWSSYYKW